MQNSFFLAVYAFFFGGLSLLLYPFMVVMRFFSLIPKHAWKRFWPKKRPLPAKNRPRIWVHALSLGEMYSVFPLLEALGNYPVEIVCTATTKSGMAAVRKACSGKLADIRFFPMDHPLAVLRTVEDMDPDFFILVETDLWPFFMHTLKRKGIPALWVNARISDKTLKGYARFSSLMRPALNAFTGIIPQNSLDESRLESLGVQREILLPCGNLKQDRKEPDPDSSELSEIREFLKDKGDFFIWVCGSLHPGEEKILAQILAHEALRGKRILCLLVPRHPEKASFFLSSLGEEGVSAMIFSQKQHFDGEKVVIIDRVGILADLYALGDAALVGGSLVPLFKGHNPLEPAMAGIPVMMGPYCADSLEVFKGLLSANAAFLAETPEKAAKCLLFWMEHPDQRMASGKAGRDFAEKGRGTSQRAVQFVMEHLKGNHAAKSH